VKKSEKKKHFTSVTDYTDFLVSLVAAGAATTPQHHSWLLSWSFSSRQHHYSTLLTLTCYWRCQE